MKARSQTATEISSNKPTEKKVATATCDVLALIAAFEGSIDVASIANRKRH